MQIFQKLAALAAIALVGITPGFSSGRPGNVVKGTTYNQPIAGSGCVDTSNAADLGSVPDNLSIRKVVSIGVDPTTPTLHLLKRNGHTASLDEFLEPENSGAAQTGKLYLLLVGGDHLRSKAPKEAAALARAKALGVPLVVEDFERDEFKSLTGLGLKADTAVVQFAPGGRAQTITLIHTPRGGHTIQSALNAVNRGLEKHRVALKQTTLDPARQAYAENIWTVWLHTGNVSCTLPYYAQEDASYPQIGNLDVGVQLTLVAQKEPLEKAINLQYVGTGFTPVAPGESPIQVDDFFKGAFTLDTAYTGQLSARYGSMLTGTASTVQPNAAVNSHTVQKTNGFSFGLNSSCGFNTTGPNCSIGVSFGFSSAVYHTQNISERVIDASSGFGQQPDPNGTLCGDVQNGCWVANHAIQDYLSSTATSDGGESIDLPNNDWYNFFDYTKGFFHSTKDGDAVYKYCTYPGCGFYNPPPSTIRNWPKWSSSSVLTEGEAGYTFSPTYTGDLDLTASFTGTEGIFTQGVGPKATRFANLLIDDEFLAFVLDLYTDTATTNANIAIDADQVNYSGMPTCAMLQYTQSDLGIYKILNETNHPLSITHMNTYPFTATPVATVADDYRGSDQWIVGVSSTTIQPGQYEYVALCSSNQTTTPAMELLLNNHARVNGALTFNGAGQPVSYNPQQVSYNAAKHTFTIN